MCILSMEINPHITRFKKVNPRVNRSRKINPQVARSMEINPQDTQPMQINPQVTRFRKINPHVTRLWLLLCLVLNFVHIYNIGQEYFLYKVTTYTHLSVPQIIEVPMMTICFRLPPSIKWYDLNISTVKKILSNEFDVDELYSLKDTPESMVREMIFHPDTFHNLRSGKFSIQDIFNLTLDIDQIILDVDVLDINQLVEDGFQFVSSKASKNPNTLYRVDSTINNFRKCYSINITLKNFHHYDYDKVLSTDEVGVISYLNFKNTTAQYMLDDVDIYYNQYGSSFSTRQDSVNLPIKKAHFHRVTYDTVETILLEFPYQTNCRYYVGRMTRGACNDDCVRKRSIELTNKIPYISPFYDYDVGEILSATKISKMLLIFNSIRQNCSKYCSKSSCETTAYYSRHHSSSPKSISNYSVIGLTMPKRFTIRTVAEPATPLVTMVTNMFSTFGFWLGYSVYSSAPKLLHFGIFIWTWFISKLNLNVRRNNRSRRNRLTRHYIQNN